MGNTIITIARTYGSGGRRIGKMIAQQTGFAYYDRNLMYTAAAEKRVTSGLGESFISSVPSETGRYTSKEEIYHTQSAMIREAADKGNSVIIGRCSDFILKNTCHQLLRVFVWAPEHICIRTVMDNLSVNEQESAKMIRQINRHRADYYKHHTGSLWNDVQHYDLCIDTSRYSYQQAAELIIGVSDLMSRL